MCVNVIGPEMQRLGCKCSPTGYCFTIEHNKEYKPEDVDIEYCEQVEEALQNSEIVQFKYIEEQEYKIVGDLRCVYVDGIWNQDDPEKWLSIIQVPVEK